MTTVMVTGAGGGIGLSILKALGMQRYDRNGTPPDNLPLRTIGVDSSPLAPGLFAGVDKAIVIPKANGSGYLDSILRNCISHGVDVLIPGTDHEIKALAAAKEKLEGECQTKIMISPWWSIRKMRDKEIMARWLTENGFLAPRTTVMKGDVLHAPMRFPFVAKPSQGSGSGDTHIVRDTDEWTMNPDRLYCVQEYLEGDEFTTSVIIGHDGLCIDVMTLRRLSPKIGEGHQMIARQTYDPGLVAQADLVDIATKLKTVGCCNIQWKYRDLRPVPFEINMRFPGSTVICAAAGMNGPQLAIEDILTGTHTRTKHRPLTCLRHLSEVYVPTDGNPFTLENLPCMSASPEGLDMSAQPWSPCSISPA